MLDASHVRMLTIRQMRVCCLAAVIASVILRVMLYI